MKKHCRSTTFAVRVVLFEYWYVQHGYTTKVHCTTESGAPLPPSCARDVVWAPPDPSQALHSLKSRRVRPAPRVIVATRARVRVGVGQLGGDAPGRVAEGAAGPRDGEAVVQAGALVGGDLGVGGVLGLGRRRRPCAAGPGT